MSELHQNYHEFGIDNSLKVNPDKNLLWETKA